MTPYPTVAPVSGVEQQNLLTDEQIAALWESIDGKKVIAGENQLNWNAALRKEFARAVECKVLASQSQAAQPSIDTPEFMDALCKFYEQASCEDFDKNSYDAARKAVLAHLAVQSQAAPVAEAVPDLHNAIMNLPCDVEQCTLTGAAAEMSYKQGHRDARHAAAELALAAPTAQEVTQQAAPEATVLLSELADAADVFMKGGVAPVRHLIDKAHAFLASTTSTVSAPDSTDGSAA